MDCYCLISLFYFPSLVKKVASPVCCIKKFQFIIKLWNWSKIISSWDSLYHQTTRQMKAHEETCDLSFPLELWGDPVLRTFFCLHISQFETGVEFFQLMFKLQNEAKRAYFIFAYHPDLFAWDVKYFSFPFFLPLLYGFAVLFVISRRNTYKENWMVFKLPSSKGIRVVITRESPNFQVIERLNQLLKSSSSHQSEYHCRIRK